MSCTLLQRALCLLLCVSAWRGPIPILHHHETLTDPGALDVHCRLLHSEQSLGECSGLHWHFAMPKDVNGKPRSHSDDAVPELAAFALAAAFQQMEGDNCAAVTDLLVGAATVMCDRVVRAPQTGLSGTKNPPRVFASRSSDVPAIAVTGVCLV